jgi:flagellar biosynthesis protein FlhB
MEWMRELLRDIIAFGSWPFYLIVLARSLVGPYWDFFIPALIAALFLAGLEFFGKHLNLAVGRLIPLAVFTILFYKALSFTLFAIILSLSVILCSYFLYKQPKRLLYGLVAGGAVSLISFFLTQLFS